MTANKLAAAQAAAHAAQEAARKAAEERDRLTATADALAEAEEKRQADEKAAFEAARVKVARETMRRPEGVSREGAWEAFAQAVSEGAPSFPAWVEYKRKLITWQEYGDHRNRIIAAENNARQQAIQDRADAFNARIAATFGIENRARRAAALEEVNNDINTAIAEIGGEPRHVASSGYVTAAELGGETFHTIPTYVEPGHGYHEAMAKLAEDTHNAMLNNEIRAKLTADLDDLTRTAIKNRSN